ncbi:LOW QUALITY PROTEIN: pectinesterase inhibitor 1 [Arabidopsis lyrata subsp. lyrata]|uniref:LOW QUALITY PROTEIN: pectinesterase inhibitor 1 n=1 Tax=Arabidopsis lyrata subsp. lyrata TaxID=81972 RepID=UPI000A29AD4E|nr:LOW QUALITY PROTEIN: pectinesterase inhibitor 1 [Arabidopsis lyrata subsp. lyrata]|eukprot:XP_020866287.1 LOW QUALITY PROTEIN: pectinesterase inhibitor 1 [Arabidopsis lyrata subsp. lyrata]
MAYVNKNFSWALLLILLLFVFSSYARLSIMVTKSEIHTICTKKRESSSLCFEVVKANPEIARLDLSSLAKFFINYQAQNISDTLKHFKLSGGYTPDINSTYHLCVELYEDAFNRRDSSFKYLTAKDYDGLNIMVGGTVSDMVTCTDDLSTMKPIPQFFMTRSIVIENLSHIILTISECFLKEEKSPYCPPYV